MILKVWSHERLNSSNKISQSRAPPSRSRYSLSELDTLINDSSPADPLAEDPSVLALFDSLVEEGNSGYYDSSSTDPDDDGPLEPYIDMIIERARTFMQLPFHSPFPWLSHSDDSSATSTDSELSFANTSSLEPPWSENDMDEVDHELRERYGSDFEEWGSHDSSDHCSSDDEGYGRVGRISSHHDDEEDEGVGTKDRTVDGERASGASSSHGDLETCGISSRRNMMLQEPSRHQPSRKVKSIQDGKSNGSANCKSRLQQDNSKTRRQQPQRKVKSAQGNTSTATDGHRVAMATNTQPIASCSNSSVSDSNSGSGANAGTSGTSEASGAGPSQRWTRKRNRRQQQAAGASSNYEQYQAEDFIKPKSPSSFYSKRDPP